MHFFLGNSWHVFLGTLKHWGGSQIKYFVSGLSWFVPTICLEIPFDFKKIYNLTASLDFGRFWQCCRGIFLQAFRGTELHLGIVLHTWNNNGTVGFPVKKINLDLIKDQSQSWSDLTTNLRTIFFWNRSAFLLRNCSTLLLWVVTACFSLNGLYNRSLKNHLIIL